MCSIHPRHLPILDAERRHSAVIIYHDTLAFHLRPVSGGQCWCPNGLLFSDLSLMSGMNAPIGIMGIILPIYTIIDMIETAENVWSDSCVCAMVDKDMQKSA